MAVARPLASLLVGGALVAAIIAQLLMGLTALPGPTDPSVAAPPESIPGRLLQAIALAPSGASVAQQPQFSPIGSKWRAWDSAGIVVIFGLGFALWSVRRKTLDPEQAPLFARLSSPKACNIISSALFLVGSILFHPSFDALPPLPYSGPLLGSLVFSAGSGVWLCATARDSWPLIAAAAPPPSAAKRPSDAPPPVALRAALQLTAALLFTVGSALFIPALYVRVPRTGCYLFIVGGLLQIIAALLEIRSEIRACTVATGRPSTHEALRTLAPPIATAVGCALFTWGSYLYLPHLLTTEAAVCHAVSLFIVGSKVLLLGAIIST